MASSKRTWLWVIFGVLVSIGICGVALVGGTAYMVSKHVRTELVGKASAEEEFVRQRERFAGQQPLIEMRGEFGDHEMKVHRAGSDARRTELQRMRVLVYDANQGRLVRVDLPFWLLRLAPSGRLGNVSGAEGFSFDSGRITVDDLERHGPGLVLDGRDGRDAQILVWTE